MRVEDIAFSLRRWVRNDEKDALQRMAAAEAAALAAYTRQYDRSAVAMRALGRSGARTVCLGQSVDSARNQFQVLLRHTDAIAGGHAVIAGATGGGKTALAIVLLSQLLALEPRRANQIIVEPKSDLVPFVRDVLVPCLVATLPHDDGVALASRFVSLNVFDQASPVPFQVLTRDATLSIEEQAYEVTSGFIRTVGLRDIGPLQESSLRFGNIAGIDLGLDVAAVVRLFRDEHFRRNLVPRISHEPTRDYFERQFPRERAAGLASLLNRLDSLLAVPGLRRLLGSQGMVRFPDLLNRRVTVIDLGGAPAGMREAQRFIGELMVARLVRAIFTRQVTRDTVPVGLWLDEFQELLTPELAADAERVLTLARSKLCFMRILHQSGAQFSDPNLLRIVRSLSNYHAVFRSDEQDARHLEAFLPVVRERPNPGETADMSESAERGARRTLLEAVPRLPDRTFLWWDKRQPHPAILARTATFPFNDSRRLAASLPRALRELLRTGAVEQVTERTEPRPIPIHDESESVDRPRHMGVDRLTPTPPPATRPDESRAPEAPRPARPRRIRLG